MKAIFFCLTFVLPLFALKVDVFEDLSENYRIEIQLEEKDLKFSQVTHQGILYTKVNFGEGLNQDYIGEPDIPRIHRMMVLKSPHPLHAEATFSERESLEKVNLFPVQKDVIDDGRKPTFPLKKSPQTGWMIADPLSMGKVAYVGNLPLQSFTVFPMNYHPRKRALVIYKKITIKFSPATDIQIPLAEGPVTSFSLRQAEVLALNGQNISKHFRNAPMHSLILSTPEFAEPANALAKTWKDSGMLTTTLQVPKGIEAPTLRNEIKKFYQSTPINHILLFGDQNQLPLAIHEGTILGDVSYSYLVGTDEFSDVSLGRLPARNLAEANYLVKKIGKFLELQAAGQENREVILVAHSEEYPGKYTKNSETIRTSPNPKGISFHPQYGGREATNASVLLEADKGANIINYRGHGSETEWYIWDSKGASFQAQEIDAFPNKPEKMPFVFNVSCSNGAIQDPGGSFVQKLLIPNLTQPYQGAIGTFGATEASYTEMNHQFNINLFATLQKLNEVTIGEVYTTANNLLVMENGGTAPANVQMYVLFSDPTLRPL